MLPDTAKPLHQVASTEHYAAYLDPMSEKPYLVYNTDTEVIEFRAELLYTAKTMVTQLESLTYGTGELSTAFAELLGHTEGLDQ